MTSFKQAPAGDAKVGEKIFKTKCAQCHVVVKLKGAGNKQGYFSSFNSSPQFTQLRYLLYVRRFAFFRTM